MLMVPFQRWLLMPPINYKIMAFRLSRDCLIDSDSVCGVATIVADGVSTGDSSGAVPIAPLAGKLFRA